MGERLFFEMGSCFIVQADLELLGSMDPPASVRSDGTTGCVPPPNTFCCLFFQNEWRYSILER